MSRNAPLGRSQMGVTWIAHVPGPLRRLFETFVGRPHDAANFHEDVLDDVNDDVIVYADDDVIFYDTPQRAYVEREGVDDRPRK